MLLEFISAVSFYIFSVVTRKLKIIAEVCIIFVLNSAVLKQCFSNGLILSPLPVHWINNNESLSHSSELIITLEV